MKIRLQSVSDPQELVSSKQTLTQPLWSGVKHNPSVRETIVPFKVQIEVTKSSFLQVVEFRQSSFPTQGFPKEKFATGGTFKRRKLLAQLEENNPPPQILKLVVVIVGTNAPETSKQVSF